MTAGFLREYKHSMIHKPLNDKSPKVLSLRIFSLPMHCIDCDTDKEIYLYSNFKVFFPRANTLDGLRLAVNNGRSFSYLSNISSWSKLC